MHSLSSLKYRRFIVGAFLFFLMSAPHYAQKISVGFVKSAMVLDAFPSEQEWQQSDSIVKLNMIEPEENSIPSVKTTIKIMASFTDIYIGVHCYDPHPDRIVAFSRNRDADLDEEDHIALVFDTFNEGRMGYLFVVNPLGARYDALIVNQGEDENENWDAIWEVKTRIDSSGWWMEMKLPAKSIGFKKNSSKWRFNVERRIQRLQETDRWAGARRDYELGQTIQAGILENVPTFNLGYGLALQPSLVAGFGQNQPGHTVDYKRELSVDATKRLGPDMDVSLTINTDFAETEVDARQTNLTRFPLFFPEKRKFFLEGTDIFEFGLGLGSDVIPFFSRKIGLYNGNQIPILAGLKTSGRVGNTNIGALAVRTESVKDVAPYSNMAVVRLKQNILKESSFGMIATMGDPVGIHNSWMSGADFTYQTTHFRGNKNFLVGLWGLYNNRPDVSGDKTAAGIKIDYPNDLWDVSWTYKRIGDGFQPSLGYVPRPGIHYYRLGMTYSPLPNISWLRRMNHEFYPYYITDLNNQWQSYRVFMAPINWRFESGERIEFNVVPQGENLEDAFEIEDGVVIAPGGYDWVRYRLEGELANKRLLSGELTWWFGEFYSGRLDQIEWDFNIKPSPMFMLQVTGELNYGRLPEGHFTQRLYAVRLSFTPNPDLQVNSFIQYDNESHELGTNTRIQWVFSSQGNLFIVYNYNLARNIMERWRRDSYQFLLKLNYAMRF